MPTLANPKNLAAYAVLRPRKSRSRNGCGACRTRRKKCDEKRPICSSCVKLSLPCLWPDRGDRSSPPPQRPDQHQRTRSTASISDLSAEEARGAISSSKVLDDQLDLSQWLSNGSFPEEGTPSPPFSESPQIRDLAQALRDAGVTTDMRDQSVSLGLGIAGIEGTKIDLLFDYFCHVTAPWLLTSDQHQYLIQNHVIPLARTDTLVLRTLLAICASHVGAKIPCFETDALEHYTSALTELNHLLSDESRAQTRGYRALLCTIVFLSHYEASHIFL